MLGDCAHSILKWRRRSWSSKERARCPSNNVLVTVTRGPEFTKDLRFIDSGGYGYVRIRLPGAAKYTNKNATARFHSPTSKTSDHHPAFLGSPTQVPRDFVRCIKAYRIRAISRKRPEIVCYSCYSVSQNALIGILLFLSQPILQPLITGTTSRYPYLLALKLALTLSQKYERPTLYCAMTEVQDTTKCNYSFR